MGAYYVILPVTVVVALIGLGVLIRGLRSGKYDDIEDEKYRILLDDAPQR